MMRMRRHHDGMMMAGMIWWASREAFVTERGLSRGAKKDRVYGGIYPQYVGV